MKKTFFIILACTVLSFSAAHAQNSEPQFFTSLHDVPLMEGLNEIDTEATAYDKPNGRIIDAFAYTGSLSPNAIMSYYNSTLPQFGWGKTDNGTFYREQEIMRISFEKHEGAHIVKISIRPSL